MVPISYIVRRYLRDLIRLATVIGPQLVTDSDVNRRTVQEAPLSPRDRAVRHVSWNLALLPRKSAETTCTTSPEQIEIMKLEGYSGPMCNKHVHSTVGR